MKLIKKLDAKRTFSILVTLIFLLSMVGAVYEIRYSRQYVDLSASKIVMRQLKPYEKYQVLSGGKILIEFQRDASCNETCRLVQQELERVARDYDDILISIYEGYESTITLTSPTGATTSYRPDELNISMLEDFICENSIRKPESCILREI